MKQSIVIGLLSFISFSYGVNGWAADKEINYLEECQSTREYVTTINYLRDKKVFALPENQARKVALDVSKGCDGAAQNFIQTTEMLIAAGLDSRTAINKGIDFSQKEFKVSKNFAFIFKRAFLKKYLDLPLDTSLNIATKLSLEFSSDQDKSREDFERLVEFCMGKDDIDLPIPFCAQISADVTKLGDEFKGSMAANFIELFQFLTSKEGPSLAVVEALKLAKKVAQNGPLSMKNYIQAYRFAISDSGLALKGVSALNFASTLAKHSIKTSSKQ